MKRRESCRSHYGALLVLIDSVDLFDVLKETYVGALWHIGI